MDSSREWTGRVRDNLHADLLKMRQEYEIACKQIEDKQEHIAQKLLKVYMDLNQYAPGDDPHKAVYLIAQCQAQLKEIAYPYRIIAEYENKRKQLEAWDIEQGIRNG